MKRVLILSIAALTSGCAINFQSAPAVTYTQEVPLSDTAVFASFDARPDRFIIAGVLSVNGKDVTSNMYGFPFWVRVLPGKNQFMVRYAADATLGANGGYNYSEIPVEISDMKPRHVYQAHYVREEGNTVRVEVQDLGENPDFGIWLGQQGINRAYYRVQF